MGKLITSILSGILFLVGIIWVVFAGWYVTMFWNFGPDPRVYTPLENFLSICLAVTIWALLPGGIIILLSVLLYRSTHKAHDNE